MARPNLPGSDLSDDDLHEEIALLEQAGADPDRLRELRDQRIARVMRQIVPESASIQLRDWPGTGFWKLEDIVLVDGSRLSGVDHERLEVARDAFAHYLWDFCGSDHPVQSYRLTFDLPETTIEDPVSIDLGF